MDIEETSRFLKAHPEPFSDPDIYRPSKSYQNLLNSGKMNTISLIQEEEEDEVFSSGDHLLLSVEQSVQVQSTKCKSFMKHAKTACLIGLWMICGFILMAKNEMVRPGHLISIPQNSTAGYLIPERYFDENVMVKVQGALLPKYYANLSAGHLYVWIQLIRTTYSPANISNLKSSDIISAKNVSDVWKIPTVSRKLIGNVPEVVRTNVYKLHEMDRNNYSHYFMRVKLTTDAKANFPVSLSYNIDPINENCGLIYASLLLILLYILMVFEIVHRTLAAMLVSTLAVAVLAALNDRPTMAELISWIDVETLLLLFSMMTMVAIFTETGIFDYMSVFAYKLTSGRVWPLINTLCLFTAVLSCFLDNVTTALLMTPVTIRLCEVMKLNPVPVLINMVIYSNIGGALTPIGDPPNVIIASNAKVLAAGVNFCTFVLHMAAGVFFSMVVVYFQLKFIYRDMNKLRCSEPEEVQDLKREIAVWKRTAASMSSYCKEEDVVKDSLMKRTSRLIGRLNTKTNNKENPSGHHSINIKELEAQYPIRDKVLLIKCSVTLSFVIFVFFLQTFPTFNKLSLGWTALLGALLLLILSQRDDIEAILARVEWSTLLFFASLFILMEALSRLGLIEWIGNQTHSVVMSAGEDHRLTVALLLMLWVSAIVSAFVDNIPLTTMMIRIAISLSENEELNLPLQPLIWALSFGACLGGNGTLFGSSSNIVCAGVAEQHGYRFSFLEFMKVGFPVTISSLLVTTVYLMVAHVWWQWH